MKSLILLIAFTSCVAFAKDKERNPASEAPIGVRELATKIKKETRTRISAYNVSSEEANACSEAGIHYSIKLQVKKAVRSMDKNENIGVKYVWETVREIDTDAKGNPMEICLE